MKFCEIVGHSQVKQKLIRNVNQGRVSHAQLFAGMEGCGALPMALAYAQYLCCSNKSEIDSCGECNSCKKHQKYIHPDVHFIFPVNRTNEIEEPLSNNFLSHWRTFLTINLYQNLFDWMTHIEIAQKQAEIKVMEANEIIKKLSLRSYESEYKMMIIWLPEKMNNGAANKILKVLEEPEGKTLFILVSENPDELLPTIISRTQLVLIPKYKDEEIEEAIINLQHIPENKAKEIAYVANGNFNLALKQLLTEDLDFSNFEVYKTWMRLCYSQKIKEIHAWVESISAIGREKQKNFLLYSMQSIRNNFARTLGAEETVKISSDENEFSQKFHQFIHSKNTQKIFDELNKAYTDIERNVNGKMVFLDISLKLCGHLRIPKPV